MKFLRHYHCLAYFRSSYPLETSCTLSGLRISSREKCKRTLTFISVICIEPLRLMCKTLKKRKSLPAARNLIGAWIFLDPL